MDLERRDDSIPQWLQTMAPADGVISAGAVHV
jgi:hypothetical protein